METGVNWRQVFNPITLGGVMTGLLIINMIFAGIDELAHRKGHR